MCVMVRNWGTEDKGLWTDHVLVGRFFLRVPGSQRGMPVKGRSGYVCPLGSGVQWGPNLSTGL